VGLEEVRADFLNVPTSFPYSYGSPFCIASFFMGCKTPFKNQIWDPGGELGGEKKHNTFVAKRVIQQYMELPDALHVTTWGPLVAARIFVSGGRKNQTSFDSSRTAWGEFLAALLMKCLCRYYPQLFYLAGASCSNYQCSHVLKCLLTIDCRGKKEVSVSNLRMRQGFTSWWYSDAGASVSL